MHIDPMNIIGKGVPVQDAVMKVTGRMEYLDDMSLPRMLCGKVLFSPKAHARIVNIDTSAAEAMPGVKAVVCYKNTPNALFNSNGEDIDILKTEMLFDSVVRHVGDRVAAVAAVDEKTALAAIRAIRVEYEDLPAVFDAEEAAKEGAYPIHEGGNVLCEVKQACGDVEAAFASAQHVISRRYELSPIHAGAIETHAAIATFTPDGALTVYSPTQDCNHVQVNLSRLFNIPLSRCRVITTMMGGSFGSKMDMIVEGVAAALSKATCRPVKVTYNRRESIASTRTRHGAVLYLKTGFMDDGTIVAQDYKVYANAGAYATGSKSIVWAMCGKAFKISKVPNVRYLGYPVMTNCPVAGAVRGFGSPQLFFALQRQLSEVANTLGMDPMEIQRKYLVDPDDADLRNGVPHGNARGKECLEKGAALFDWYAEAEECRKQDTSSNTRIGIGVSTACHITSMYGVLADLTGMILKMNMDGTCTLLTPNQDMGNGSVTLQKQFISSVLGLSLDRIETIGGDTSTSCIDFGSFGSRGAYVGGLGALKCAEEMKKELQAEAGKLLEVDPATVEFGGDCVWSGNKSASVEDVVVYAHEKSMRDLAVSVSAASNGCPIPYGAHFAKVQVNIKTGDVKVLKYAAVHDVGRVINPLSAEGQVEGAIAMGMGQVLCESAAVDENGAVKQNNFRSYKMMKSTDMPEIKVAFADGASPVGPYGAKSLGECSIVPSLGALANAISHAIGAEVNTLPATPQRILKLIEEKA